MKELTEKDLYYYGRKVVESFLEYESEFGEEWTIKDDNIDIGRGSIEFECIENSNDWVFLTVSNIDIDRWKDLDDDDEFFECAKIEVRINSEAEHFEEVSPYNSSIKYFWIGLLGNCR